jgi:hypothetical protein
VTEGVGTIIYPVKDIAQATKVYSFGRPAFSGRDLLGWLRCWRPTYRSTSQCHNQRMTGPLGYADNNIIGLIQVASLGPAKD